MSEYSIYTLFGNPAETAKKTLPIGLLASVLDEKKWSLIVERQNGNGHLLQRDVTSGLTLFEAIDQKDNLRKVYVEDGWLTQDGSNFYAIGRNDTIIFYVDVEVVQGQKNLIPA